MMCAIERRSHSQRRHCSSIDTTVVVILIISILLGLLSSSLDASNQHQRRSRSTSYSNTNNNNIERYDRSVTTFDPNGHLLQVEYAHYAATQRTKRTIVGMILNQNQNNNSSNSNSNNNDSTILIAITNPNSNDMRNEKGDHDNENNSLEQQQQSQQQHVQYLYRISKNIYMIGIGLMSDIRIIASHLRIEVQQFLYNYGDLVNTECYDGNLYSNNNNNTDRCTYNIHQNDNECEITVHQVATILSKLQHQFTYQSGIRPLGISCFIFGFDQHQQQQDDTNTLNNKAKLYKCSPGGLMEDCYYCTSGYNEVPILQSLHKLPDCSTQLNNNTSEADIIEHFVTAINNSTTTISNEDQQSMDVWVIRDGSVVVPATSSSSSRQRNAVTCFAGLCSSNKDSFMKLRQYYNEH